MQFLIHLFFVHPIYDLRTFSFSFSLPSHDSRSESTKKTLVPPPRYGTPLCLYREKTSALSSLVDSHRIDLGWNRWGGGLQEYRVALGWKLWAVFGRVSYRIGREVIQKRNAW